MRVTPVELVLRCARATVGACESPPNTNRGPFVERVLAAVGLAPGNPWCMAWAWAIGATALGAAWPVPKSGGCAVTGEWAKRAGVLDAVPMVGDLFLKWEHVAGVWRFAHTGFLDGPPDAAGAWPTIEGNTSGAGSREGWIVGARRRTFAPDDAFVRWVSLCRDN